MRSTRNENCVLCVRNWKFCTRYQRGNVCEVETTHLDAHTSKTDEQHDLVGRKVKLPRFSNFGCLVVPDLLVSSKNDLANQID